MRLFFKLHVGSSHFVVWLDLVGANLAQVHLHVLQSCSRECGTQRNLCHVPVALTTIIYSTSRLVDSLNCERLFVMLGL